MALQQEFDWFLQNRADLVKQYDGKFIVIKDQRVLGTYESELEAVLETQKNHELGTFLVQKVDRDKESYQQTFHSRVA